MNLPALRKNTEFWYSEVGRRAEGKNKIARESKR